MGVLHILLHILPYSSGSNAAISSNFLCLSFCSEFAMFHGVNRIWIFWIRTDYVLRNWTYYVLL